MRALELIPLRSIAGSWRRSRCRALCLSLSLLIAFIETLALVTLAAEAPPGEGLGPGSDAPATVTVRPHSEVDGPVIHLGEIADIDSPDAGFKAGLAGVEVGQIPLPSYSRSISRWTLEAHIKRYLKESGIDPGRVNLECPESVKVTRKARRIEPEELVRVAEAYVRAHMPWKESEVNITCPRPPREVVTPVGKVELVAEAFPTTRYLGTTSVKVNILHDGKRYSWVSVPLRLDVVKDVVVTKHHIDRYQVVTEDDVTLQKREILTMPRDVLYEIGEAVGMRATRTMSEGEPVTRSGLERPPVVLRGDAVTILSRVGQIEVRAPGEALGDGGIGDVVLVRNRDSGKLIHAIVVERGIVKPEK